MTRTPRRRPSRLLSAICIGGLIVGSLFAETVVRPPAARASTPLSGTGIGERPGYTQLSSPLSDRIAVQVNPGTGNLELRSTDLTVRGTGLNYAVVRYWNSLATGSGAFGVNGSMSNGADVHLAAGPGGVLTYSAPSGFTEAYTPAPGGSYTVPAIYQAADLTTSDTSHVLTFRGSNEKLTFDSSGRLVTDADRSGNTNTFAYNSDGTLRQVTDTQGRITGFNYTNGLITQLTDPSGRHCQYDYDASGNLIKITDMTGAVWKLSYWEGNSNLDQIVDPRGNSETFTYDASHRVTKANYAAYASAAASTTYSYSAGSTTVTDPLGHTTNYSIDSNGRVVSVTDPLGNARATAFDATGNVTSRTDPSAALTHYTSLSTGQLTSVQMPTESTGSGSVSGAMTTIAYGNTAQPYLPSQVTDPQGGQTRYGYDTAGNQTTATTYNADGTATSSTSTSTNRYQGDPSGSATVNCGAHAGELCSSTNPRGSVTSYSYDGAGNVTTITPPVPLGHTTLGYDGISRITSSTDGKGVTTTLSYDADDRITSTTTNGSVITYGYDQSGDLISRHDATGTTTYSYDATGHLTNKAAPVGWSRSYTYDLAGNLKTSSDSGGPAGTVTYAYDAANECTSVTDGAGAVTNLTWAHARRTSTSYPGGVIQTVLYDNAGRPIRTTATHGSTTLVDQTGVYQTATGADRELLQQLTDTTAGTTTTYSYDGLNRLIDAATTGSTTSDYKYILDAAGNRTQSITNGVYSAIDTFNGADQLVSRGGATFGAYDADGNATSDGTGQSYGYSATNQTTAITPSGGSTISASYADSDQTERLGFGNTTSVIGLLGDDQDTTGSTTNYYTRDPSGQLVNERTPTGTYYYLYDLRGSVIGLTNSSGVKVDSYSYDPYGTLTSPSSAAPTANPWRYNAGYYDVISGFYHFGARYYDPKLGRFTQIDPSYQEFNEYLFSSADPINSSDPSGESTLGNVLKAGGIIAGTAAALTLATGPAAALAGLALGLDVAGGIVNGDSLQSIIVGAAFDAVSGGIGPGLGAAGAGAIGTRFVGVTYAAATAIASIGTTY